jgi:hypothetical protein
MSKPHRLDVQAIVAAYRDGESAETIAKQLGASGSTVCRRLHAAGIPRRATEHRKRPINANAVIDAYARGESLEVIAHRERTTPQTISRRLDAAGIPRRPAGRAKLSRALLAAELHATYRDAGRTLSVALLARWAQCSTESIYRRLREQRGAQ